MAENTFKPGTIGYYLNQLPEPYRTQALENAGRKSLKLLTEFTGFASPAPKADSVQFAFAWVSTPQGHDYWLQLCSKLHRNYFLAGAQWVSTKA